MAIKVGEVYVEVFPRINAAARKAAVDGIAGAFRNMFNNIDRESNASANSQIRNQTRVRNHVKRSTDEQTTFWTRLGKIISREGQKQEGTLHKLATGFRTIGTLMRGLTVGVAVVQGLRLIFVAMRGISALLPVVNAGLLSIPFAIGAAVVEAGVLGIAFRGVGKAIGLAFDPTKAKQFQEALKSLSPAARRFVLDIAKAVPILKGLQEHLFAAPALQRAGARFGGFIRGLQGPLDKLAAANGNLIGKILGVFTNSRGLRLSIQFINILSKIIRGITPGLMALTRAFQIIAVRVGAQFAARIGGINGLLEKLANWLIHINIASIFQRAHDVLVGLKPVLSNVADIFKGIIKALGGRNKAQHDFIESLASFTKKVADWVNSSRGQRFIKDLDSIVKSLASLSSSGGLAALQAFGLAMQIIAPALRAISDWAAAHPKLFNTLATNVLIAYGAFKLLKGAIQGVNLAIYALTGTMGKFTVLGLLASIVRTLALAIGAFAATTAGMFAIVGLAIAVTIFLGFVGYKLGDKIHKWLVDKIGKLGAVIVESLFPSFEIGQHWTKIKSFFTGIGHWFTGPFVNFFKRSGSFLNGIFGKGGSIDRDINKGLAQLKGIAVGVGHWFAVSFPNFFKVGWHWVQNWGSRFGAWWAGPFKNFFVRVGAAIGNWFSKSFPNFFKVGWHWVQNWASRFGGWFAGPFKNFFVRVGSNIGSWFKGSFANFFKTGWHNVQRFFESWGGWFAGPFKNFFLRVGGSIGNWFKGPFVGFFKSGWHTAQGIFNSAIQGLWRTMKRFGNDVFAGPWNWVAKHIFNEGILKAWNAVAGILGLKSFSHLHLVDNIHFASGGRVRGPGGPREDKIPAMLSNGEFVVNAASTRKHLALLHQINAGEDMYAGYGFAKGGRAGAVWPSIVAFARSVGAMAGLRVTSTTGGGHAPHSYHYSGMAVDVAGSTAAMNRAAGILYRYGRYFLELFHSPRWFIKNGQPSRPIDYATHFNHIHMAMSRANATAALHGAKPGAFLGGLGGGGGGISLPPIIAQIWGFVKKGVTYFSDPIMKLIKKGVAGGGLGPPPPGKNQVGGGFVRTVLERGVPKLLSKGASIITSKVGSFVQAALNFVGGFFKGSGKFDQWFAGAIAALRAGKYGAWTESLGTWKNQIGIIARKESNLNPNAINRSDSNARRGDPSRGIMQTTGSTFRANHVRGTSGNIYDPVANIAAAILYIKRRYGSVSRTPWFTGKGTYYSKGGLVGGPLLRDSGGILPPGDWFVQNHTGKNEYISKEEGTSFKELHIHVADKHFVPIIDGRIAKHDNDLIQFVATR